MVSPPRAKVEQASNGGARWELATRPLPAVLVPWVSKCAGYGEWAGRCLALPGGSCTSQTDGATTRYCFSNGMKATTTGSRFDFYGGGMWCYGGTITAAGKSIVIAYDSGPCGTLIVTVEGKKLTIVCNGTMATVDQNDPTCTAEVQSLPTSVASNTFTSCIPGSCP